MTASGSTLASHPSSITARAGAIFAWAARRDRLWGRMLFSRRRGYLHHGIYVGQGKVVHYGGLARGLRRRPVEEVSLTRFAAGRPLWTRCVPSSHFDREEVIRRARSRVGEVID